MFSGHMPMCEETARTNHRRMGAIVSVEHLTIARLSHPCFNQCVQETVPELVGGREMPTLTDAGR